MLLESVLKVVDTNLLDPAGKPVAWPAALAGDKAYRAKWIDDYLLKLGIRPVIPSWEKRL